MLALKLPDALNPGKAQGRFRVASRGLALHLCANSWEGPCLQCHLQCKVSANCFSSFLLIVPQQPPVVAPPSSLSSHHPEDYLDDTKGQDESLGFLGEDEFGSKGLRSVEEPGASLLRNPSLRNFDEKSSHPFAAAPSVPGTSQPNDGSSRKKPASHPLSCAFFCFTTHARALLRSSPLVLSIRLRGVRTLHPCRHWSLVTPPLSPHQSGSYSKFALEINH
jgi:hypothetical protein